MLSFARRGRGGWNSVSASFLPTIQICQDTRSTTSTLLHRSLQGDLPLDQSDKGVFNARLGPVLGPGQGPDLIRSPHGQGGALRHDQHPVAVLRLLHKVGGHQLHYSLVQPLLAVEVVGDGGNLENPFLKTHNGHSN